MQSSVCSIQGSTPLRLTVVIRTEQLVLNSDGVPIPKGQADLASKVPLIILVGNQVHADVVLAIIKATVVCNCWGRKCVASCSCRSQLCFLRCHEIGELHGAEHQHEHGRPAPSMC